MIGDNIFRIQCLGHWLPSQVRVEFSNRDYVLPGDLPGRAQRFWDEAVATRHDSLFNGMLCRLDAFAASAESLRLDLSRTCYRDLLFSNSHVKEIVQDFGERALVRALGISAVVETADGFLPLMRRSASLGEGAGKIDVFGGHIHPDEHVRPYGPGVPDVFLAIADETHNELGIMPDEHGDMSCLGILENWLTRKPELVFAARLPLSMEELRVAAANAEERHEYVELLGVPARGDAVEKLLQQEKASFAPSGYGCLVLFGKLRKWW